MIHRDTKGLPRARWGCHSCRSSRIAALLTTHHKEVTPLRLAILAVVFFATISSSPSVIQGQSDSGVTITSNEQLFDVMTALNVAGCDTGLFLDTGDDTRRKVRSYLAKKDLPVAAELAKFYQARRIANNPPQDLRPYISLALLLGPPPRFSYTVPEQDLPPSANSVKGFVPLVRTLYEQANLGDLYSRLGPRFLQLEQKYAPTLRRQFVLADAYLREPSANYLGRHYRIYLSLMAPPDQVQTRIYGEDYYAVVTPSVQSPLAYLVYQYLHFILDPLAVKYGSDIQTKAALGRIARDAPALDQDYKDDFSFLVTECLIRAVQLRLDHTPDPQKAVKRYLSSGLILAPYFYSQLEAFEKQPVSMTDYFDRMIEGIDVSKLEQQLDSVQFMPPPRPPSSKPAAPAQSAKDQLLDRADNFIYRAQYGQARQEFEQVLKDYDPKSERALYGLAVVASNLGEPDIAVKYFKKTLSVAHRLRIVTWSHIYLGRIYDLEGNRDEALTQYRAAAVTAAKFPDALRALNTGLQHPFGGGR
jgi:tetratricopeptide (TPR) repeat protein